MSPRPLAIVVAKASNGVIGKDGGLPWNLPEDLRHFKAVTLGHVMLMGRKTWDSIGRPLPGRQSFVISRQPGLTLPGARVFRSLAQALEAAYAEDDEPRVIGGAQVYAEALPLATRLFITEVAGDVDGDTRFPPFDADAFVEQERRAAATPDVQFVTLARRAL